jgi:Mn2+/Fe2+ NRAMP family transporter
MFVNKKHKKRAIIGVIFIIVTFMAFAPHGSIDPTELGFWLAIAAGLISSFATNYSLYFTHKKYGEGSKKANED